MIQFCIRMTEELRERLQRAFNKSQDKSLTAYVLKATEQRIKREGGKAE